MRRTAQICLLWLALLAAGAIGCRAQAQAPTLRDEFRKVLMEGRQASPLKPQPLTQMEVGTNLTERVRITPEEGQDAVVQIYRPKPEGKYPTIIVQHFLGGTKDHIFLLPLITTLAQRGFLVAAIDGRYRGERQNGTSLEAAMVQSLRTGKGHPFLLDTAYDVLRLLDYLQTRPDVDPERIGMTGLSEGGIITWMCAAADERIKVAIPVIGVTNFTKALDMKEGPDVQVRLKQFAAVLEEHAKDIGSPQVDAAVLRSAWDKLVPGMLGRFDATNLVPLIAPRPLLILSHELDELFPVDGAREVYAATKARYEAANASDRVDFRIAAGAKHAAFNAAEMAGGIEWMERWLKR